MPSFHNPSNHLLNSFSNKDVFLPVKYHLTVFLLLLLCTVSYKSLYCCFDTGQHMLSFIAAHPYICTWCQLWTVCDYESNHWTLLGLRPGTLLLLVTPLQLRLSGPIHMQGSNHNQSCTLRQSHYNQPISLNFPLKVRFRSHQRGDGPCFSSELQQPRTRTPRPLPLIAAQSTWHQTPEAPAVGGGPTSGQQRESKTARGTTIFMVWRIIRVFHVLKEVCFMICLEAN